LPRLITLVGSIHRHGKAFGHPRQLPQQLAAFGRIVRVARQQSEGYGRSSIRGNHMHLGVHPPRLLPMACGPFF